MLRVTDITKQFNRQMAVNHVNFEVQAGDTFGLLGPNGAGKSTTISIIAGLFFPDSGDVTLHGQSIRTNPRYLKRRIGLVPQSIALYDHLTAKENLEFWGTVYGIRGAKLKDAVRWCLELSGLTDKARQQVKHYSGGMKRRLNIAVAMVHRPEILIMDEPTVGIDPQSRNHILGTIKTLSSDGMTVIYTSHYMEEVQYLCQRLAIMDHGRVIAYGGLDDVRKLAGSNTTIVIEASDDVHAVAAELRNDLMMKQVTAEGRTLTLLAADSAAVVSKTVLALSRYKLQPTRIDVQEPNLESAFLQLTGRRLRDDAVNPGEMGEPTEDKERRAGEVSS